MKKRILSLIILTSVVNFIFSQEMTYKVVEKKGNVDIKVRSGKWESISEGDLIITGTEIFTGLHSHLSLEIESGSYLTIKQLSHITIDRVRIKQDEISSEFYLKNGYVVALSKNIGALRNRILVVFSGGNVQFDNAGGEIYLRQETGAIVKSFIGKVSVRSKIRNSYFVRKHEVCGITPDGHLVESDYFLRRGIATKPLEYTGEGEIIYFYRQLLNYYS